MSGSKSYVHTSSGQKYFSTAAGSLTITKNIQNANEYYTIVIGEYKQNAKELILFTKTSLYTTILFIIIFI